MQQSYAGNNRTAKEDKENSMKKIQDKIIELLEEK